MIIKTGKASASYLQRMFRIGYARAASLLDMLEMQGVVGPADGAKPREVLINKSKNQFTEDEESEEETEEEAEPISELDATVKKNIKPEKKEEIEEEIDEDEEQAKIEEENTEEEEEDEF